ncbi:protein kinase [Scytonema hofmannii FACHB-248]|uniref:non-specific serine/threonine protein kinase n=1 Tax=Scytonema hofmannii FACHB-248 TaxID=1842502 RepID=A0ABR8GTY8_9CYAN|nr:MULTISPECIES: protein kinase [Nostocales]MBD2606396.1 protein kinase [Scytonema hofmannii FACHB-248]
MGKLVVINLVEGNFETGFSVSLQIWTEGDRQWIAAVKGKLPPATELHKHYTLWQSHYRKHVSGRYFTRISVTGGTSTSIISDIKKASKQLKLSLNDWLKADSSFSPIREKLFQNLKDESEEIRVIFETENLELQRLPWHLWDDFFKHYHRAEVALSLPVKKGQIATNTDKVKVLAVFGKDTRINTKKDWQMLEERLAQDSNALLININKPKLDNLCDQIDKHKPQILFFAGHSRSEDDGESGFIDLDDEKSITIDDLEPDLRKAVKRGLQLAIFNSCDGLGIARQLAQLHVPNIIVMREPVPDQVAQMFLQRFLEAFAQGKPLHLAVRRAREKINRLENQFPGATWLPMTFQNPAEPPLTWRSLGGIETRKQTNQVTVTGEESEIGSQGSIAWLPTSVGSSSPPTPPPIIVQKVTIICNKGHKNSSDNRFCIQCGEALNQQSIKLSISCSQGHENSPQNSFCSYCGECLRGETNVILPTTQPQLSVIQPETELPPKTPINSEVSSTRRTTEIGSLLNERYRILKILGQGGFGKTFIAEDINLPSNPQCVVKQLNSMTNNPEFGKEARRLFLKEAEVLERLGRHDQIPGILAYFEENYEFYLVQEYIEGHTLSREIYHGKQLHETQVSSILHDILKILEFVHQQNIIHRDVKPSNLIRRKQDQKIVLIDFGAVKQVENSTIGETVMIGTPGYAPSEQMAGRPSFSSDIYAVGIIGIEALTGISPHQLRQNSNAGEIFWRDNAQVSDELAAILDKMVRYDFRQRYQSATEVLQALENMQRIVIAPTVTTPNPTIISGLKSFLKGFKF